MADAKILAPSKKEAEIFAVENEYLAMEFEPFKKYMFELAVANPERELPIIETEGQKSRAIPSPKFKPYQNIVFTSQIIWKNQRRIIRYYDGCTSIFSEDQPKDRDELKEYMATTKSRAFLEGKFGAFGDEKMLLLYMNICSWNANSPFRTRSANAIFVSSNNLKIISQESKKLEQTEDALKMAKEAPANKMLIHAAFLNIPEIDYDSGNALTEDEIRVQYRKRALGDAAYFIETYGNKSIETKYYIKQALLKGLISNKLNPNKAAWQSGNVICDISGLKSNEAIEEKLFEFSQLTDGEEFVIQLKALFS